jgi:hypothetical protein
MATLTLKKPKRIGDRPLVEFQGNYVVMRHARSKHSLRFTSAHQSQDLATKEARRLAKESQTERYIILQIVDHVDWVA